MDYTADLQDCRLHFSREYTKLAIVYVSLLLFFLVINSKMSDYLLQSEKKSLDSKLKVTNSSLNYINQPQVDDSDIALAVDISYPVLMKWHGLVGTKDDEGNTLDYITLLNSWIPGHCFKINKIHGSRILGRLRREAGVVVNKHTGKKDRKSVV